MEKAKQKFEYLKTENRKDKTEMALYSLLYEPTFPFNVLQMLEKEEFNTLYQEVYQVFLSTKTGILLATQLYPYVEAKYIINLTETDSNTDTLSGREILDYGAQKKEEKANFYRQHYFLLERLESFIGQYQMKKQQKSVEVLKKYKEAIEVYVNDVFPKENFTNYCIKNHLVGGVFSKYLRQMYPTFYEEYHNAVDEFLIDEDGSKERRFQQFEQFLKEKPNDHIVDAIDFYAITKEKPSRDSIVFQARTKNSYSIDFLNFVRNNPGGDDLTLEDLLSGNRTFAFIVNGTRKKATPQELENIYNTLLEKGIAVFEKSVSAQLRRNLGLNTDIDAKEYMSKKELKKVLN